MVDHVCIDRVEVSVNGTRLWFDVDGPALVPDRDLMRQRPTVVLVHGGPGSYDHSYFKPDFARLANIAQIVYLDLRDHGRSARHAAKDWTFEICADDVAAFCDTLGIAAPIVFGHSMGGFVAMLYGARHPGRASGLVLQSTMARFDLDRLVAGFRRFGGDTVAELARRDYGGDSVTDEEWARIFAAFGPGVPNTDQLGRRIKNLEIAARGAELFSGFDVVDELGRIDCPTLVCVGQLDPVTPVQASKEVFAALRPGLGRLEVVEGAGHFPWLDAGDRYWRVIVDFVESAADRTP
jgi:pimeloyl-ACP methyl ester carboxylesterase